MTSLTRTKDVKHVDHVDDCDFYHSMSIPGVGEVTGQWDLRGGESNYLGGVRLRGKKVLEIGPASGYMSFWMERQGANVTCLELGEDNQWDFVPFANLNMKAIDDHRKAHLRRLHNSWWFTRAALESKVSIVYGSIYNLDKSFDEFDIVTLSSVLLHLRDPFGAIARAASVCKETIIITDVAEEQAFPHDPSMWDKKIVSFLPRKEIEDVNSWFFITSATLSEYLTILGFEKVKVHKHTQMFGKDPWRFNTIVGRRRSNWF